MSAELRIALGYFSFVPLQRWMNGCGIALLVMAAVATATHTGRGGLVFATATSVIAAVLIAIGPVFAGGAVLRFASTPLTLQLRPHGRRRMLLGATLAITLVALVVTFPAAVMQLGGMSARGRTGPFMPSAFSAFLFIWGFVALLWVAVFATSRSQWLQALLFPGVFALGRLADWMLLALPLDPEHWNMALFLSGIAAWALFCIWYARTPSITRQDWASMNGNTSPNWNFSWLRGQSATTTSHQATRHHTGLLQYLLGIRSMWAYVAMGIVATAALLLNLKLLMHNSQIDRLPVLALPYFALFGATLAPTVVRRARMLWLRAGLDRQALFRNTEGLLLRAECAVMGIPAVLLAALSMYSNPHLATEVAFFTVIQITAAFGMLYAGLGVTRGWNGGTIFLFTALSALVVVEMATLEPSASVQAGTYCAALLLASVMLLVLRWRAKRRWLQLDWRLTGPPLLAQRMR